MRQLFFNKEEWNRLQRLCEAGYPKEVCGVIFGKTQNQSEPARKVEKIEVLENILNGKHAARLQQLIDLNIITLPKERAMQGGNYEFVIDPQEYYQKINAAERAGLDQIGVFHSHPDHPAVPSPTDAAQPLLSGWSVMIVAVDGGKFKEARSWFRNSEELAFQEENILLE